MIRTNTSLFASFSFLMNAHVFRNPILLILLILLILPAPILPGAGLPNILWITSEDNGPHLGCYGDSYAKSPHLDWLASIGMRYTHASSNAPVCAPARTTIISGIYPPATGSEHMRSMTSLPEGFKMYPQYLREKGYYCTNNSKEDYNLEKPGQVWDESDRNAHWKNRAEGQPFFAVFNHTISHESQIRNDIDEMDRIHDPAMARVPAYHPDTPEVRKDWAQYYDRITMMDAFVGKNLKELEDAGLSGDTIVFYYGDHGSGMPRNKRWPYFSGLNVPLIVSFPEKWRSLAPKDYKVNGESGRLVGFIDLAPTVLSIAGIKPPAEMQGHAFAGKFETNPQPYSYGFRGRMDERYDMVRSVLDGRYIYIRNYMPHRIYGQYIQYMFVTPTTRVWHDLFQEGKLNEAQSHFWNTKAPEELYDLESDRDEVDNLAGSPQHQTVLSRMRQAQEDWARRIKDAGFLPEGEIHSRSEGGTPYAMGHDPAKYPLEKIMGAANTASSLDPDKTSELAAMLNDDDSAVRYWAAMGLLMREEAGVTAAAKPLRNALKDESPYVRIAAAEALGRYGNEQDVKKALAVLIPASDPAQSPNFVCMAAMNALDYLDDRAEPALDQVKGFPGSHESALPRTGNYIGNLKAKILSDFGVETSKEEKRAGKKERETRRIGRR